MICQFILSNFGFLNAHLSPWDAIKILINRYRVHQSISENKIILTFSDQRFNPFKRIIVFLRFLSYDPRLELQFYFYNERYTIIFVICKSGLLAESDHKRLNANVIYCVILFVAKITFQKWNIAR